MSTLLKSNSYIEIYEKLLFCTALLDCYSSHNGTIQYKLVKQEYPHTIETQLENNNGVKNWESYVDVFDDSRLLNKKSELFNPSRHQNKLFLKCFKRSIRTNDSMDWHFLIITLFFKCFLRSYVLNNLFLFILDQ